MLEFIRKYIKKAIERKNKRNKTFVLTFHKICYDRQMIESLSEREKYELAISDKRGCCVYTSNEYTDLLNNHKPMETYVFTYIVNI